ncbi:MAG: 5-(carboxyamino)imidazole ribonucleotide synthase, partial [Bacteroidota bacterium]
MKAFYRDLQLGILGGGQLGRMLIQASIDLNVLSTVMDPVADAPCSRFAPSFQQGSLTDYDAVMAFGKEVDLLTIEIENVQVDALEDLEKLGKLVFPQPHILRMIQDKRLQKQYFRDHRFPTADFILVENQAEVRTHADRLPAVNKTGKAGYDGRG